jgi:hypothetical protein
MNYNASEAVIVNDVFWFSGIARCSIADAGLDSTPNLIHLKN